MKDEHTSEDPGPSGRPVSVAREPRAGNLPPAPDGYDGSCLRPRGLCELGGCCDLCLHNPEQQPDRES